MTPITPIKAPALADLRNALQLAVTYGDKDTADAEAKQALGRIRGLIARALAKLGEPNEAAIQAARAMSCTSPDFTLSRGEWDALAVQRDRNVHDALELRMARDAAAVILHAALTGEAVSESWVNALACPDCHGSGMVGSMPCDQCKGAGKL